MEEHGDPCGKATLTKEGAANAAEPKVAEDACRTGWPGPRITFIPKQE